MNGKLKNLLQNPPNETKQQEIQTDWAEIIELKPLIKHIVDRAVGNDESMREISNESQQRQVSECDPSSIVYEDHGEIMASTLQNSRRDKDNPIKAIQETKSQSINMLIDGISFAISRFI